MSFAQYASAASARSGDAPPSSSSCPRHLRGNLVDAERSADDLADDVHHPILREARRTGEEMRRAHMPVVEERPHRDGGDVPRVDGEANRSRVRQADDVAGADLGRPCERVGREPAGSQDVHPSPDVRIRRSISAWMIVIGWVCCSRSSSTVNEET